MPTSARHRVGHSAELYSLRRAGQERWLTLEEKITCHTCCKSSALTNAYGISQLLLGFILKIPRKVQGNQIPTTGPRELLGRRLRRERVRL